MPTGILIVDKPADWTSQDVVSKLRGVFHEKRIGHGGTLDPMATGVLPIFAGRATRAVEFFESAEKEYIAGLRLGVVTDTQDTTGTVLAQAPVTVTREEVAAALSTFLGAQQQLPPMYSAVKIGGQKLYELARKGREVARKPRDIVLHQLELLDGAGEHYTFRVRCSKGTYVRTLCHDLGQKLGCGGCMESLRRTAAGCYTLDQAVPLAEVVAHPDPASLLIPIDSLFAHLPWVKLQERQMKLLLNGALVPVTGLKNGEYRVYDPAGGFAALCRAGGGRLKTIKSFFEVKEP